MTQLHSGAVPFTPWDAFWLHLLVWATILYVIGAIISLLWPTIGRFKETLVDYTTSLRPTVLLPSGSPRCARVTKIARVYYMTLYGGRYLPPAVRWVLRIVALLLPVLVLRFVVVEYLNKYGHQSFSYYTDLMLGLFVFLEAGLWWRDWQLARRTGSGTLGEQRLYVAKRLFKSPEALSRFRARVERSCGASPAPPAPVLAPFWPENRVRVSFGLVARSIVGGLLLVSVLRAVTPGAPAWNSLSGYVSAFIGASVAALLVQAVAVYSLLVLGALSSWPGTYPGRRYFPLQVLLWDLRDPDQS